MQHKTGLSENEWYIMQALWDNPGATLRDLCDTFSSDRGWTKHAISSFLKRMLEKGAVAVNESGKLRRYFAVWSKEDTIRKETHSILNRVYQGDLLLMVSNAVQQQELTQEEVQQLKDMLDAIQ